MQLKKALEFKRVEEDKFYNRRKLAVFSLAYAVVWGFIILFVDVVFNLDTGKTVAYLGFVATVCGLPTWGYLNAASKDDEERKQNDIQIQ